MSPFPCREQPGIILDRIPVPESSYEFSINAGCLLGDTPEGTRDKEILAQINRMEMEGVRQHQID
jgi:hypothetical protein